MKTWQLMNSQTFSTITKVVSVVCMYISLYPKGIIDQQTYSNWWIRVRQYIYMILCETVCIFITVHQCITTHVNYYFKDREMIVAIGGVLDSTWNFIFLWKLYICSKKTSVIALSIFITTLLLEIDWHRRTVLYSS